MKTWENPSQEAINENDLAPLPWISSIHHYLYRKLFQSRTFHFQSNRVMYILLKIIVNVYIKNHILVAQCIEFLFFFSIFFFISRYKLVNDIREQISSIRRWALLLQLVLWGMASNPVQQSIGVFPGRFFVTEGECFWWLRKVIEESSLQSFGDCIFITH